MCFRPPPSRPPLFRVVLFSILQFIGDNTLLHVTILKKHTNGKTNFQDSKEYNQKQKFE